MIIIGIDPGPLQSGVVFFDTETAEVMSSDVEKNPTIRCALRAMYLPHTLVQEMPASYGMAVGASILETCVQVGRFMECGTCTKATMYRKTITTYICGQAKANASMVRQSIIDMYGGKEEALGGKKCKQCKGKGTVNRGTEGCLQCEGTGWSNPPGPLYHVKTHAWDALAVAIAYAIKAGYLNPSVVNPGGLGSNFQSPAHDGLSGLSKGNSIPQDEPF